MSRVQNGQDAVNSSGTRDRTAAGDLFSALVVQPFRAHGHLVAAGDALSRPAGQTTARWQVLATIEREPATVAGIARAMALTRQSVQRVADLLAEEGLAAYEENSAHRRAKLLRLTPAGRDALAVIQSSQRVWANAVAADIGEDDLQRAGNILTRVLTSIAKHPPPSHEPAASAGD